MPPGGEIIYSAIFGTPSLPVANTASIVSGDWFVDPDPSNNQSTVILDPAQDPLFADGFESGNASAWSSASGPGLAVLRSGGPGGELRPPGAVAGHGRGRGAGHESPGRGRLPRAVPVRPERLRPWSRRRSPGRFPDGPPQRPRGGLPPAALRGPDRGRRRPALPRGTRGSGRRQREPGTAGPRSQTHHIASTSSGAGRREKRPTTGRSCCRSTVSTPPRSRASTTTTAAVSTRSTWGCRAAEVAPQLDASTVFLDAFESWRLQ